MQPRLAFSSIPPPPLHPSEKPSTAPLQHVQFRNLPRRALLRALLLPLLSKIPACAEAEEKAPYDAHAAIYDILDAPNALSDLLGLTRLRRHLISKAHGKTLELAVGTGVNLPFYQLSRVKSITALDLSNAMLSKSETRIAALPNTPPIRLLRASAEDTQLPAGSFDTVLQTFSLCVFQQPRVALSEMKRLVAPGGSVLLLEHTLSPSPVIAMYQNLTAEPAACLSKGCFANRDVVAMVKDAGFRVDVCEYHLAGTVVYLELTV